MKRIFSAIAVLVTVMLGQVAHAQDSYWVQIEAKATLREAEDAARDYAARLDNVNGFRLSSGWYAMALGPYTEEGATDVLIELRRSGAVPRDAYLTDGAGFTQQFWPVGVNALNAAPVDGFAPVDEVMGAEPAEDAVAEVVDPATVVEPAPVVINPPEETRTEALASERLLDRPAREELQIALQWEGFYNSAIDGAFGPGTRRAMGDWQAYKGYDATGVLTTRQRQELLAGYNAVIDSLGLKAVTDARAGISVDMPTAMVAFDRYEAPFAHYEAVMGDAPRVVLISQSGDKSTLYGLYDILQSLEVVPPEGPRSRADKSFTIEGSDGAIVSYTYAEVVDGGVKGFMLIWPRGDEKRRTMVLNAMKGSFASTGATVLDDNAGLDVATQSVDLLSGLEIRRPDRARSGVFVDMAGHVLTTGAAVAGCERIMLNDSYPAHVLAQDSALGLAVLAPDEPLAPIAVARFATGPARLNSDLAVAGYSYGGRLSSPSLTWGTLADVAGLDGNEALMRLSVTAQDGDAGGPVLDAGGTVLGLLSEPEQDGARQLPEDVAFAVKAPALVEFLAGQDIGTEAVDLGADMTPHALNMAVANMTVLVSCWE